MTVVPDRHNAPGPRTSKKCGQQRKRLGCETGQSERRGFYARAVPMSGHENVLRRAAALRLDSVAKARPAFTFEAGRYACYLAKYACARSASAAVGL